MDFPLGVFNLQYPDLNALIMRRFKGPNDVEEAREAVYKVCCSELSSSHLIRKFKSFFRLAFHLRSRSRDGRGLLTWTVAEYRAYFSCPLSKDYACEVVCISSLQISLAILSCTLLSAFCNFCSAFTDVPGQTW